MKETDLNEKELNMYKSLKAEIEAKFRHINTGSYQSKYRYKESVKLMARVLVSGWEKKNLNRVRVKHIQYFADYMKNNGYSNSSITTNLSGVRYYFDHTSSGKQYIPTNKELGVKPRSKAERINVNRSMPEEQYNRLFEIAKQKGRYDFQLKLKLGKELGLRIHEIFGIRKSDIRKTLKDIEKNIDKPTIRTKGKNGLIRFPNVDTVEKIETLKEVYEYAKGKEDRFFAPAQKKDMHKRIKDFQRFFRENRDSNAQYPYTPHSMRHSYAQNEVARGELNVVEELGHGRKEIIKVYIDNVEEWN